MKKISCICMLVVASCRSNPEANPELKPAIDRVTQPSSSAVVVEVENHEAAQARNYRIESTQLRLLATQAHCEIEVGFGSGAVERLQLALAPPCSAATWQSSATVAGRSATFSQGAISVGSIGDLMAFRYPETQHDAVILVTGAAQVADADARPEQVQACARAAQGVVLGNAHARVVGTVSGPELCSAREPAERLFRASLRL